MHRPEDGGTSDQRVAEDEGKARLQAIFVHGAKVRAQKGQVAEYSEQMDELAPTLMGSTGQLNFVLYEDKFFTNKIMDRKNFSCKFSVISAFARRKGNKFFIPFFFFMTKHFIEKRRKMLTLKTKFFKNTTFLVSEIRKKRFTWPLAYPYTVADLRIWKHFRGLGKKGKPKILKKIDWYSRKKVKNTKFSLL